MSVDLFANEPDRFSSFFHRVLSLCLDTSLTGAIRDQLLSFLICAFQSLDNGLIRKECIPLVSISIWQHLHSESVRELKFEQYPQLKKAWRTAAKRYETADDANKSKLRFERAWLYSMILDCVGRLNSSSQGTIPRLPVVLKSLLTFRQKICDTASDFSNFSQTSKVNYQLGNMSILLCRT